MRNESADNPNLHQSLKDYEPAYLEYLQSAPEDGAQFGALRRWMASCGVAASARLVDVGCGSGKFVRYLRSQQFSAVGIEPAEALFDEFLRPEACFFHGSLEEWERSADAATNVDVVTAFDVLEHVDDPVSLILGAKKIVRPGGLVLLTTPDAGSIAASILGKHWPHFNKYHRSLMKTAHIKALGALAGLEIVSIGHMARYKSLHYVTSYILNFGLRSGRSFKQWPIADAVFPINTFDVFFVCLRRPAE